MRILLATGIQDLENDVKPYLTSHGIECFDCYHRIAVIDLAKKHNVDAVLISRNLKGDKDIIKLIDILAGGKVKVFALPGDEDMSDAEEFVIETVLLGVNNYIYDPPTPEKILDYLEHPRSRHDVKREWVEEAIRREKVARGITKGIGGIPAIDEPKKLFGFLPRKPKKGQDEPPKKPGSLKAIPEMSAIPTDSPVSHSPTPEGFVALGMGKESPREAAEEALDTSQRPVEENGSSIILPEGFVALGRVKGISQEIAYSTVQEVVAAKPLAILVAGTRWIKSLRRQDTLQSVPIVVVGDEHDPSLCVAAGADECVSSLDHQAIDLILARVDRKKATWAKAGRDPLTGCFNRGFLDSYLAEERRPTSALMLDLDHFKRVNDTYGHAAGDEVLRQFVIFVSRTVRETDVVARYGGEEFVVLLPGATIEHAAQVAEKICFGWREQVIETESGVVYSTVSIGVAGPGPDVLKNADKAVYAAKGTEEAGRDRWVRFDQMDQIEGHQSEDRGGSSHLKELGSEDPEPLGQPRTDRESSRDTSRVRNGLLFRNKIPDVAAVVNDLMGHLVVVWNMDGYKKGEVCITVAGALSRKVTLVEYDLLNPTMDSFFDIPTPAISDLNGKDLASLGAGILTLGNQATPERLVKLVRPVKKLKGVSYLAAGNSLGAIDVGQKYASVEAYKGTLDLLKARSETVIVDTETQIAMPTTAAAFARADVILVPMSNPSSKSMYDRYKRMTPGEVIFCLP